MQKVHFSAFSDKILLVEYHVADHPLTQIRIFLPIGDKHSKELNKNISNTLILLSVTPLVYVREGWELLSIINFFTLFDYETDFFLQFINLINTTYI